MEQFQINGEIFGAVDFKVFILFAPSHQDILSSTSIYFLKLIHMMTCWSAN